MEDESQRRVDRRTRQIERRINEIYGQARIEIEDKIDEFNRGFEIRRDIHLQELADGTITQEQYNSWLAGQMFQSQQWNAKRDQICQILHTANEQATTIVNGGTIGAFAEGANWAAYSLEHDAGVNFGFGLYDSRTVTNLIVNNPQILPEWRIDEPKEYVWNQRAVNNCVTQGIIQGENINQIATRIATATSNQDRNLALTHARTSMTAAQNAGRVQRLQDAKSMGIKVVKQWMATLDGHTRDSHRNMDGETKPVGDKWHHIKFSNGCEYPGDPKGPAREVFNCRCTMVGDLEDFPDEYRRYDNIEGKPIDNMTYREWEAARREEARRREEAIRYADFGGSREVYDIMSKYRDYRDFLSTDELSDWVTVTDAFDDEPDAIARAFAKIEEERASIVAEVIEDEYSKYGGEEVYDILSRYRSFDDFENFSSVEEVEKVITRLRETMGDDINVRDEITHIMDLIREDRSPIPSTDMPYIDDVNDIWRQDTRKVRYHENYVGVVRANLGVHDDEAEEMLNASIRRLVDNSDLGSRIDAENLISVLNDGRFMNQFETGTSHGALSTGRRTECERGVFGVPTDTSGANRPIYGMLFPRVEDPNNVDSITSNFYKNGPGTHYGNCVVIFRRENVMNNTTLTLGDSLDDQYAVGATRISDPVFTSARGGNAMLLTDPPQYWSDTSYVNEVCRSFGYAEIQLHGVQSHSIDNIERVIVDRRARGADELIRMLDERGIPYTYM